MAPSAKPRLGPENDLQITQLVILQSTAGHLGASPTGKLGSVGEVYEAVVREPWVQCDIHQSALTASRNLWKPTDGPWIQLSVADHTQPPRTFRDQHSAVR